MDVGLFNMPGKSPGDPFLFPHSLTSSTNRLPTLGSYNPSSTLLTQRAHDAMHPGLPDRDMFDLPKLSNSGQVTGFGYKSRDDPVHELPAATDKRKKPGARTKSILGQVYAGKAFQVDENDKPMQFNPDPLPFQSSAFNKLANAGIYGQSGSSDPPLSQVQVIGMAVSLPNIENQAPKQIPNPSRSSTIVKKVPVTKRHGDMWAGPDYGVPKNRGLVLHSDRYQWESYSRSLDSSLSQRDRLMAEFEYLENLKGLKRKREMLSHREPLHFHMGGQKIEMFERDDIMSELNRLKQVILPTRAKDLYVGRGFKLPEHHALNKPRVRSLSPHTVRTAPAGFLGSSLCHRTHLNPTHPALPMRSNTMINLKTYEYGSESKPNNTSALRGRKSNISINVPQSEDGRSNGDSSWPIQPEHPLHEAGENVQDPATVPHGNLQNIDAGNDYDPQGAPGHQFCLLQGGHDLDLVDEDILNQLDLAFKEIDIATDAPWELVWDLIRPLLPIELTESQEKFAQQVFDVDCELHQIQHNEFVSLGVLCMQISKLKGPAYEAFDPLNWNNLQQDILHFSDLFRSVDLSNSCKISHGVLRDVLGTRTADMGHETYMQMKQVLSEFGSDELNKIDFVAHIPYFLLMDLK